MTLNEQHQWLQSVPENAEDYLDPAYYDGILKGYYFGGREDLDILDEYLEGVPQGSRVLELGCGSGRATERIVEKLGQASIDLVDLSGEMVGFCETKFGDNPAVNVYQSDSIDFLARESTYDSVVTLWNLSHSIHQHMFRLGREGGSEYVGGILDDFLINRLAIEGTMHMVHYDIQSPEQRLVNPWRLKLWEAADPTYDASGQSPSKLLIDETLSGLKNRGYVDYSAAHLKGDPIVYESAEVALETFLNFHMEGHFNNSPELPEVIKSLQDGFAEYTNEDGTVSIAPGAFVYDIKRVG